MRPACKSLRQPMITAKSSHDEQPSTSCTGAHCSLYDPICAGVRCFFVTLSRFSVISLANLPIPVHEVQHHPLRLQQTSSQALYQAISCSLSFRLERIATPLIFVLGIYDRCNIYMRGNSSVPQSIIYLSRLRFAVVFFCFPSYNQLESEFMIAHTREYLSSKILFILKPLCDIRMIACFPDI